ncbi:MAG: hypothetical protein J0L93_06265 [Deltaproteobacteria bacterium]|nr:hypothetical protein [Deltaproteobacteria bacterium]
MMKYFLTSFVLMGLISLTAEAKENCSETTRKLAELQATNTTKGAKALAKYIKNNNRIPSAKDFATYYGIGADSMVETFGITFRELLENARTGHADSFFAVRERMIRTFTTLSRQKGELATLDEMATQMLTTKEKLETIFGKLGLFKDFEDLKATAIQRKPAAFEDVRNESVYSPERKASLMQALRTADKFIYTSVLAGKGFPIEEGFFQALKTFHEKTGAPVFVRSLNNRSMYLDKRLLEADWIHILTEDIELDPWNRLNTIELLPKQMNPTTGLNSRWLRNQTQFIAAPKIEVKSVATANRQAPHMIVTTGSLSEARYAEQNAKTVQRRSARLAGFDHLVGAVLIEKNNGGEQIEGLPTAGGFHWRHIEYIPEVKGFVDLNTLYTGEGSSKVRPEALVLGDTHAVQSMDQKLLEPIVKVIRALKPKRLVLHDFWDGETINHHLEKQTITKARLAKGGEGLDVSKDLDRVAAVLNGFLAIDPEIEIILAYSNHPAWLSRWLQEKTWAHDPINAAIGSELDAVMVRGEDPLEYALLKTPLRFHSDRESERFTRVLEPNRVKFIPRDSPGLAVGPSHRLVQIGYHGHQGPNGKPNNLRGTYEAVLRAIYGHVHADSRRNGTAQLGTGTNLDLSYTAEGFSSWTQSIGIAGPNGEIQVYQFKNGEFFKGNEQPLVKPERFWLRDIEGIEYPKAIPLMEPTSGAETVDQYSQPPKLED